MAPTDYDRVPYRSHPYQRTHPDHLAAVATLFGRSPAPVATARILEIGCSSGGNLLPLAAAMPEARFVGIDPAASAIGAAAETARLLGLRNVELLPVGVEALPAGAPFDYVVAHGVLSWIPPEARAALWAALRDRLAPEGVVYLSWNAYPGWSVRGALRHMMRWHVRALTDPMERVAGARALVRLLCETNPPTTAWGRLLQAEQRALDAVGDWYLFHDHLAEHNQPFWFAEVEATAAAHGLAWLAEVEVSRMVPDALPPTLPPPPTREDQEQYLDFVRMQVFRETLWVRAGAPVDRVLDPARLSALSFTLRAQPTAPLDPDAPEPTPFRTPEGATVSATDRLTKAVLAVLWRAERQPLSLSAVHAGVEALVGPTPPRVVAEHLLAALLGQETIAVHRWPTPWRRTLSPLPEVFPYARLQAARGEAHATNLRHEGLDTDALDRVVLQHLDGRHDRARLTAAIRLALGDVPEDRRLLDTLLRIARSALLVG